MASSLVPVPPSSQILTSPPRTHPQRQLVMRGGSGSSAISLIAVLQASWARGLRRDEVGERKNLQQEEKDRREDVEFLISLAKTERRMKNQVSPARALSPANASAVMSFPEESPRRGLPTPPRPIPTSCRKPTAKSMEIAHEEEELRSWIERLEMKMREPIETECVDSWMIVTGPQRSIIEEADRRKEIEEDWVYEQWQLARRARREKPYYNAGPPPSPPPEPPLPWKEVVDREAIEATELAERISLHAWLDEKYAVRIFSVKRVENVCRTDIEEEESEDLHDRVLKLFKETFPEISFLGILGLYLPQLTSEDDINLIVEQLQDIEYDLVTPDHVALAYRAIFVGKVLEKPKAEEDDDEKKPTEEVERKKEEEENPAAAEPTEESKNEEGSNEKPSADEIAQQDDTKTSEDEKEKPEEEGPGSSNQTETCTDEEKCQPTGESNPAVDSVMPQEANDEDAKREDKPAADDKPAEEEARPEQEAGQP